MLLLKQQVLGKDRIVLYFKADKPGRPSEQKQIEAKPTESTVETLTLREVLEKTKDWSPDEQMDYIDHLKSAGMLEES